MLFVGCGSDSGGDEDASAGAGRGGLSAAGGASARGGSASQGGTAGVVAGGEPDTSQWIMPLRVGRTWNFAMRIVDESLPVDCTSDSPTATAIRGGVMDVGDGTTTYAWFYKTACVDTTYLVWMKDGVLSARALTDPNATPLSFNGEAVTFLVDPELQSSWTVGSSTNFWERVGSVTVAAGTFTDCWRRTMDTAALNAVYCRGTGLVSSSLPVDNYELELTSLVDE
jgi:hypothetical protein